MEHLIPDAWFTAVGSAWILLAIVAVSVGGLGLGADQLVSGAANLALRLGVGKVIVGATIVSLGTTTPEAAVSVLAAWEGNPGLALGNGLGSIVCDTALIFGTGAMLARIPADRFVLARQGWLQFGSGALLVVVSVFARFASPETPTIGRGVGMLFLAMLVVYLVLSIRWGREHPESVSDVDELIESPESSSDGKARSFVRLFAGLAIVLVASRVLIGSVSELAVRWGVPDEIVAATLVAFGTSVPEFATAIVSIRRGHPELLVGNVIGADILNVLFVIGGAAVAAPLVIPDTFFVLHFPFLIGILAFFRFLVARSDEAFPSWSGPPLLVAYAAYVALQYAL